MIILHYFLGFPPFRTGGMTKFVLDLMLTQTQHGDKVISVWPGRFELFSNKVYLKEHKKNYSITNFEIINPLPIPYDEGIKDVNAYTKNIDKNIFTTFFKKVKPDVVHIHTFMGLHIEFIQAAKECGIKTIFSAHDFFPICPKVTMYRNNKICNCDFNKCPDCNSTALSLSKIQLLQQPIYVLLKETILIKFIRKKHREHFFKNSTISTNNVPITEYQKLRHYYSQMIFLIDVVHYNSTITKDVYNQHFNILNYKIFPITHIDIRNHKIEKKFTDNLRITYLGSQTYGKGYYILKLALDKLWEINDNFILNLYFKPNKTSPYMKVHKKYNYHQLKAIFDNTDVLIVPSTWYETFGYVVLEALSYGVPVIVSSTVGAKDIIENNSGIIINDIDENKLFDRLKVLSKNELVLMNKSIVKNQKIFTIDDLYNDIRQSLY